MTTVTFNYQKYSYSKNIKLIGVGDTKEKALNDIRIQNPFLIYLELFEKPNYIFI
ncbi:MAG: hypothetical protein ACE1ZQ_09655 [Ignavibacteriaceae bacterium]